MDIAFYLNSMRVIAQEKQFQRVLLVANILVAVALSAQFSIDVPTKHIDGAFQTASGLFRLEAGQWPGKDFLPYLGLGPLFLLYPLFLIAGGDVAASEFAAWFATLITGAFSVGLVVALVVPRHALAWASITGCIFLFIAGITIPGDVANYLLMMPGNSLRPIRTFEPFLFLPAAYYLFRHVEIAKASVAVGVLAGIAPLWSNDYGIPTAVLLIIWIALESWRTPKQFIFLILQACLSCTIAFVSVGLILTQGSLVHLLSYWFIDVRQDQWWYFGPWTRASRVYDLVDLIKVSIVDTRAAIVVLVGVSVLYWREPTDRHRLLLFIGIALYGGGLLSTMGGHRDAGYFSGFVRWAVVVVLYFCTRFLFRFAYPRLWWTRPGENNEYAMLRPDSLRVGVICGAVILVLTQTVNAIQKRSDRENNENWFGVPELGGYLPIEYLSYIEWSRNQAKTVIEEYWGLLSGLTHRQTPVQVDSIIHALGSERMRFNKMMDVQPPDAVITTPRSYSPGFQSWSISANWWFYRTLLQSYQPMKSSRSTLIWRKTETKLVWPKVSCAITGTGFQLSETIQSGYYEIDFDLNLQESLTRRGLVLVKNNINQAFLANGYLSIDPHVQHHRLPIRVLGQNERFDLHTLPNPGDALKLVIKRCNAYKIPDMLDEVLAQE